MRISAPVMALLFLAGAARLPAAEPASPRDQARAILALRSAKTPPRST